ncbi:hypothetical protein OG889_17150 [Streptomyces sp. NBC_00481]|uniref:hypothetical protein n=1 Tax=Streptomyces sp. NBC_00481 TaxID=2975755 RepID=UPI002DD8055C|nr:hypothetical protein [Streptomyces sp. NBC_00481]WRY96314.1 hypothetical protein OG889_17150 [Streptomyces sp. NBC_00481]
MSGHTDTAAPETEATDSAPPAVRFQVQREFHAVPLGMGADEVTFDAQLRRFARDYWGADEDLEPLRKLTTAMYAANTENLVEGGAVYNALGVFPIGGTADDSEPPERISRATLTVSVRDLLNPDPHFTATGIAEALDKAGDGGEIQLISLPAGPAVVRVAGSRALWELPGGEAGEEGELERFFVRIEVWVPFPGEDRLLLLCLSTADVEDLFHYQAVLADIADTVAFGEAEAPTAGAEAAPASPPPSPFGSY